MKILLTGMTSQHTNPDTHLKRVNFMGVIRDALRSTDDEVYWQDPSVTWDDEYLKQFDAAIVGVAPLGSLGANRAYGALNVITRLWNSGRLTLLVDAPDSVKLETSAQAVIDHPANLVKDFFRYRKEYRLARDKEHFDRLYTGAYLLRTQRWPKAIYPWLPWQDGSTFANQLYHTRFHGVTALNLDAFLFERWSDPRPENRHRWWSYERSSDTRWIDRQNLCWRVDELPRTHRMPTNDMTIQQLANSRGTLIGSSKAGTWWTPRYAMSLSQGTPVFSEWMETRFLHDSWNVLPSSFEMMADVERTQLLTEQSLTYQASIPNRGEALSKLYGALNLDRKADTWMVG
jgi:hypothetical protein